MAVTPLDPSDPERLGDYVVTGRLGAGGMGMVYLGEGPDGTPVAVKLVRADLAHDPTFRERFRREVEALRRVAGPRVAVLLAADTEAPQPYLVVEFVDGPTLADSIATNGPLGGERLRALAAALAEALVLIHEVGVIHRDLKPSNVILAADQPKLVDFGIAAATGSMPLTVAGTVIGSAGWMAPEQAAGEVSTPAVDVFTWASLVAYAGTGRPPFGLGGPEEVTARILSGDPDLGGLPQEVRPFVEAAFIKDPASRPTARALLAGLVGGQEASSTEELVEETTHLIEHTWMMPVTGWPGPADPTPPLPPPPLPVSPADSRPSATGGSPPPPSPRPTGRTWPVVVGVAVAALALGALGAALILGDGGEGGDAASATTAPTTTLPPTTTTLPFGSPVDVTVDLVNIRNDLTDLPGGQSCTDEVAVTIEDPTGEVLVGPVPFDDGEPIPDTGDLPDCRYRVELAGVPLADRNLVILTDSGGDFDPLTFTRAEIFGAGDVVEVEVDGLGLL